MLQLLAAPEKRYSSAPFNLLSLSFFFSFILIFNSSDRLLTESMEEMDEDLDEPTYIVIVLSFIEPLVAYLLWFLSYNWLIF